MGIKLDNYKCGYQIVSLALNEEVKNKLIDSELNTVYVSDDAITLLPANITLSICIPHIEYLRTCNNYDVFEIWNNGVLVRRYNDKSTDNYLFITSGCNSNCIMCPSPEASRKKAKDSNISELFTLAKHIPNDTPHITITGGEPFLIGEKIFPLISFLKERFPRTEFLFLTNGRIFAVKRYLELLKETIPPYSIVAIPIHGSNAKIHDEITRTPKSFEQTKSGIKNLLKNNICVELRVVLSKLNVDDFAEIANLIIDELSGIEYVSIIAMEMTGTARTNLEKVWIPYKETFSRVSPSIRKLVENGIDVKLYNFPLCTVESAYWTLCEKSISDNKVKYAETCDDCKYKKNCGGVFAGTYNLERDELKAIL